MGSQEAGARRGYGPVRATLVSITCLLRGLPLFFSAVPATPLRVLCILALDTIHVLRCSRPLSRQRRAELAVFLDFQACANAAWDGKRLRSAEYDALRLRLEKAGLASWIGDYLSRLHELEARRPSPGGDLRRFDEVRSYREAGARLSLAAIAGIALEAGCLDAAVQATEHDRDVLTLFRMAMQCQIIDDVLDYQEDVSMDLPSFLTASASLPQAAAFTAQASRSYAAKERERAAFPLDAALSVITAVARVAVAIAAHGSQRWRRPDWLRPRRPSSPPAVVRHSTRASTGPRH